MVEQILAVEAGFDHAAVMAKKFEECMDRVVNDFNVKIIPEYLLFNAGLKQFTGDAEIADLSRACHLIKYFPVVFLRSLQKNWF